MYLLLAIVDNSLELKLPFLLHCTRESSMFLFNRITNCRRSAASMETVKWKDYKKMAAFRGCLLSSLSCRSSYFSFQNPAADQTLDEFAAKRSKDNVSPGRASYTGGA